MIGNCGNRRLPTNYGTGRNGMNNVNPSKDLGHVSKFQFRARDLACLQVAGPPGDTRMEATMKPILGNSSANSSAAGFSLIELTLTLAIYGLLLAFAPSAY